MLVVSYIIKYTDHKHLISHSNMIEYRGCCDAFAQIWQG